MQHTRLSRSARKPSAIAHSQKRICCSHIKGSDKCVASDKRCNTLYRMPSSRDSVNTRIHHESQFIDELERMVGVRYITLSLSE